MSKFYCLYNSKSDSLDVQARITVFEEACAKYGIEFVLMDELNTNFSKLPIPTNEDGLYNSARGSFLLERTLINKEVKTFYKEYPNLGIIEASNYWSIIHEKENIATPKTIFKGTNNKELLQEYVAFLEGFPIILKTYGGTGGVGVMKVNSWDSLFSVADYLVAKGEDFAMKQFIISSTCERLTVIGNKVIAGVSRPNKENDFRSDVFNAKTYQKEYSNQINQLAIDAVQSCNMNLGGVDIIIDERTNKPYVLEINMPLNFIPSQNITSINIGEEMISWLFNKNDNEFFKK